MKNRLSAVCILLALATLLTSCGARNAQDIVSDALGIDAAHGREVSNYDTHSGNGDGASCVALRFQDDTVLEEITASAQWKAFPLDEIVNALVYGIESEAIQVGPYLTDGNGNPLVPEIQNGYYLLIDRQTGKHTEADILHRYSFNFSIGLYDSDTNTLYFCQLDT